MAAHRNPAVLTPAALSRVRGEAALPAYDRDRARIGVVHLGPGAFHRAHQGPVWDRLLERDPRWAVSAVSLRSPDLRDALAPQVGLYALQILDAEPRLQVIGAVKEILVAAETPEAVLARLASPDTRLVTLTVTEKGYCLGPDGRLDAGHPDIVHDLEACGPPRSAVGWLAQGLRARRAADLAPFDVLSCDNLADNGRKLGAAVIDFAGARDPGLAAWIAEHARFPCSMVDSITPATDDALRARVAAGLGLVDAWPVQREAYSQWVVEDSFSPGGPDWASAGVEVSADVRGWEHAKLRLLNGAHSSLAYLGLLAGLETVEAAVSDPALAGFVRTLMINDIAPLIRPPAGLNLGVYIEAVLARFANPAIRHLLSQIAWDGSQKLPVRLLATLAEARAARRPLGRLALPVAAWMRFVVEAGRAGRPLVDPLAGPLAPVAAAATDEAAADVARFLALDAVFTQDLAGDRAIAETLEGAYADLTLHGARETVRRSLAQA